MPLIRILTLLVALFILGYSPQALNAQETLVVPFGSAPTVDGDFSSSEWDDATSITVEVAGTLGSEVYLKHDGTNLYFAFSGTFGSSFLFPEINIDPENTKSGSWMENDWWFHISGTDCESKGQPNDYSDCAPDQEDWFGIPNFAQGKIPEVIEVIIPFTKLGVGSTLPDTLGMALDLTNTLNTWYYWPIDSEVMNPSTWGTIILLSQKSSGVIDKGRMRSTELNLTLHDRNK